ncbi:MAG: hypothetical protein BZY81_00065 [SAR202 cluster bacterium Io17-Chloro-G4]|nr:MAG: hypothetical protein BZY81_00065 [SAR202 cluster bacterium Io17-Chloro-G4]
MNVGFIGLGNMGGPMASWVIKAGLPLVVHDIREEAASPLLEQGAVWANSPAEAASQSDIVCVCVPGPPEMEAVSLGPNGAVEGLNPGAVFIDHTTNSPETVRAVGEAVRQRGAHMLDAPLDGGREGALAGEITLFVGGGQEAMERARPVFESYTKSVVWVGELGAGAVTKIVHNALAMGIDLLLAECMTLGVKAGVSTTRLVEAFSQGCIVNENMTFTKRLPQTLFKGDFTARFALKLAHKDFGLAGELSTRHGVPTRIIDLCQAELLEAMNRGWGDYDRTISSTLQEERSQVQLRTGDSEPGVGDP